MIETISQNAYRILGLPVIATKKEIAGRLAEIQTYFTIGQLPDYDTDFPWMGKIQRTEETVRHAAYTLEINQTKIEHAIHWFWVFNQDDCQAIEALKIKDIDQAISIWAISNNTNYDYFNKNLANLLEILAFNHSLNTQRFSYLKSSSTYWAQYTISKNIQNHIKKIDMGLLKEFNEEAVINIIINHMGQIALMFFRDDDLSTIDKLGEYFKHLKGCSFTEYNLSIIINTFVRHFTTKIDKILDSHISTIKDYNKLFTDTKKLHEHIYPTWLKLKQTGDGFSTERYGDKIGNLILNNSITIGNNTQIYDKCSELQILAKTYMSSNIAKRRLEANEKILNDILEQKRLYEKAVAKQKTSTFVRAGLTIFFTIIFFTICYYVTKGSSQDSQNTNNDYQYSKTNAPSSNTDWIDKLHSKIEAEKTRLNEMEATLNELLNNSELLNSKLETLSKKIKQIENDNANGIDIDYDNYQKLIKKYNDYVNEYNYTKQQYENLSTKYNALIDSTKNDINYYNKLIQ